MNISEFDRDFKRMQRRHDRMAKVVGTFIAIVFLLVLVTSITAGVLVFKAADEVGERGLKSVLTELWEGPQE